MVPSARKIPTLLSAASRDYSLRALIVPRFMIDVVSQEKDWAAVWRDSNEHAKVVAELDEITKGSSESSEKGDDNQQADNHKYASSQLYQNKIVLRRANAQVSLMRFRLPIAHHFRRNPALASS